MHPLAFTCGAPPPFPPRSPPRRRPPASPWPPPVPPSPHGPPHGSPHGPPHGPPPPPLVSDKQASMLVLPATSRHSWPSPWTAGSIVIGRHVLIQPLEKSTSSTSIHFLNGTLFHCKSIVSGRKQPAAHSQMIQLRTVLPLFPISRLLIPIPSLSDVSLRRLSPTSLWPNDGLKVDLTHFRASTLFLRKLRLEFRRD